MLSSHIHFFLLNVMLKQVCLKACYVAGTVIRSGMWFNTALDLSELTMECQKKSVKVKTSNALNKMSIRGLFLIDVV